VEIRALKKTVLAVLMTLAAPLALTASLTPALAQAPAATAMTPDQITAFNTAVTEFSAGQTAQQAGDNATAATKYEAALPAIRKAVEVEPNKIDNVNFLANALYADAAAQSAQGKTDKVIALFNESVPHWRKVVAAKPSDAVSRDIFTGVLTQLGNQKLVGQDKPGADAFYTEAVTLARKSAAEKPTDAATKNLLLSALIGQSQTSADPKVKEEAVAMSKAMLTDGTVDAVNKPSAQALTGTPAAG
jgi:tetratricopeptide (TPR) repeat protein